MQTFSFQVMLLHFNLNRLTTTTVCCWNFANLQWHATTWINQKLVQELEPWIRRWVSCSVSTTNTLHWSSDERCSFKGNSSICLHSGCSLGSFKQRRRRGQWERKKAKQQLAFVSRFFIQLFRERLSEKVHATIPKGIVGVFDFTVLRRNFKEWHEWPWTYVCEC